MPENMPKPSMLPASNHFQYAVRQPLFSVILSYLSIYLCLSVDFSTAKHHATAGWLGCISENSRQLDCGCMQHNSQSIVQVSQVCLRIIMYPRHEDISWFRSIG